MTMLANKTKRIFRRGLIAAALLSAGRALSQTEGVGEPPNAMSDAQRVDSDYAALNIPQGYARNLHWDLPLPASGKDGSSISWKSSNPLYLSDGGKLLQASPTGGDRVAVELVATIRFGMAEKSKSIVIHIAPAEQKLDGYLFAYFEGSGDKLLQEQLRFAASTDAVNWSALNGNKPILVSKKIAQTGGIRDPHILRGEDRQTFYAVATDMFAIRDGWKGSNPGIVMLKSNDLINWKHGIVDLAKAYPGKFPNVKWVWAPQTIYDPAVDKYLVYFVLGYHDSKKLDFFCAYANDDFTAFAEEPRLMFSPKYGGIDADIIYRDGTYHFFYKGNVKDKNGKEVQRGIQQATSTSLQGPWVEDFKFVDAYSRKNTAVEGSTVFKLNGVDKYVLMYDLFLDHRFEFQYSADLSSFEDEPRTFNKNFSPRHGSVIGITREEAVRLNEKWGGVPAELLNAR